MNKQEFTSQPKYSGLSRAEKEQRWRAYSSSVASSGRRRKGNTMPPAGPTQYLDPVAHSLSMLPTCATHYLQALEDPFGLFKAGTSACIPDLHAVPSKKVHAQLEVLFPPAQMDTVS